MSGDDLPGTVWAATWVHAPPPVAGSDEAGFAVAWVDVADGRRVQAFVDAEEAPPIGAGGTIRRDDDLAVEVFTPGDGRPA